MFTDILWALAILVGVLLALGMLSFVFQFLRIGIIVLHKTSLFLNHHLYYDGASDPKKEFREAVNYREKKH